MPLSPRISGRCLSLAGLCAALLLSFPLTLQAQLHDLEDPAPIPLPTPDGPPVPVHGTVLNASTGQPLPRALVTVVAGHQFGVLTDGEGHFDFPAIPSGAWPFSTTKPGFSESGTNSSFEALAPHTVRVAADMAPLTFSLSPDNAIYGQITLSTGVPAQSFRVQLLHSVINDGRTSWTVQSTNLATPRGDFRFSNLSDGTYLVRSLPEFENDHAELSSCSADTPPVMDAYSPVFYENSEELTGASRIEVSGGRSVSVNLTLNQTRFHLVQIRFLHLPTGAGADLNSELTSRAGLSLPYEVHQEKDHTLCTYLPDGAYTLTAIASGPSDTPDSGATPPKILSGILDFTVQGQPERNLRLALGPGTSAQVHFHYQPAPPPAKPDKPAAGDAHDELGFRNNDIPLDISANPANGLDSIRLGSSQAEMSPSGTLQFNTLPPGPYWIHATANQDGVCVGSVTAAGQNLTRVPWLVGPAGSGPPIDVLLRTDCAKLTVQLPLAAPTDPSGAISIYYVYVVPEFDSPEGIQETRISPLEDQSQTLPDLPPGPYRVFTFLTPHTIEFRNPEAISRLGEGQPVLLTPGATASLTLQVTQP